MIARRRGIIVTSLRASLPELQSWLGRLSVYFQEVPEETAHFSRDAELLRQVQQASAERVALISELLAALEALHRPVVVST